MHEHGADPVGAGATRVDPSAQIEADVELGDGVAVWGLCHVRTGARIGAGTSLGRGVFVDAGVRVGRGCKVQNGVSLYRGVTLEDEVFVGPAAVFSNDRRPRAHRHDWMLTPTLVRTGASLGAGSVTVCGTVVGRNAMVGAGAVVTRDVPDHALVVGNPARLHGWVCACGEVVSRAQVRPEPPVCPGCAATT